MDVVEDLNTFVDVTPDLEADESHDEEGGEEQCKLPLQEGYDAFPRRVSLASLWAESGWPLETANDGLTLQPPHDCPEGQPQGGTGLQARAPDVEDPEENDVSVQGKVDLSLDIFSPAIEFKSFVGILTELRWPLSNFSFTAWQCNLGYAGGFGARQRMLYKH